MGMNKGHLFTVYVHGYLEEGGGLTGRTLMIHPLISQEVDIQILHHGLMFFCKLGCIILE